MISKYRNFSSYNYYSISRFFRMSTFYFIWIIRIRLKRKRYPSQIKMIQISGRIGLQTPILHTSGPQQTTSLPSQNANNTVAHAITHYQSRGLEDRYIGSYIKRTETNYKNGDHISSSQHNSHYLSNIDKNCTLRWKIV